MGYGKVRDMGRSNRQKVNRGERGARRGGASISLTYKHTATWHDGNTLATF